MSQCESCAYYVFDEDFDEYVCEADMDEDDYGRLVEDHFRDCPYYYNGDDMIEILEEGNYWSSTVYLYAHDYEWAFAIIFNFDADMDDPTTHTAIHSHRSRHSGLTIRPVKNP
jgi:hypothetical protein